MPFGLLFLSNAMLLIQVLILVYLKKNLYKNLFTKSEHTTFKLQILNLKKTMTFVQKCVTSWNQAFLVPGMRTHAYLRQIAHKHIRRKSQPILKKVTSFRKLHSNEFACIESSSSELHGCHWSTRLFSNRLVLCSS